MGVDVKEGTLTAGQQRVLLLLFKFRFVSAQLLAQVMGIRRRSVYETLERLVDKELVTKVFKNEYRLQGKSAYYYLNKSGVTTLRQLMDVKESVVHALYKNGEASEEFIDHCLKVIGLYASLMASLPDDSDIFAKAEINRFSQFPKNRPDLYIRTPEGQEAIVVLADDMPAYIARKRLDEIIAHSEDEGWDGDYPRICFVLKDDRTKHSFLYTAHKKLESMGFDAEELHILAASLYGLQEATGRVWADAFSPKKPIGLFE